MTVYIHQTKLITKPQKESKPNKFNLKGSLNLFIRVFLLSCCSTLKGALDTLGKMFHSPLVYLSFPQFIPCICQNLEMLLHLKTIWFLSLWFFHKFFYKYLCRWFERGRILPEVFIVVMFNALLKHEVVMFEQDLQKTEMRLYKCNSLFFFILHIPHFLNCRNFGHYSSWIATLWCLKLLWHFKW